MEDGKITTLNEMWRGFQKEEVADLPHHAQCCFKVVLLRTSEGHIHFDNW